MTKGRLELTADGKIVCPDGSIKITYASPWPTPNGTPGGFSEPAQGRVVHTEVGYEHAVEHAFEDPAFQASSFCSISGHFNSQSPEDGHIHQYAPIGKGFEAWTQVAGNSKWRGDEHEDGGDPTRPFTKLQIASSGSLTELYSREDGWPLEITDDPINGTGLITHQDGGLPWGGHSCPGPVRTRQRTLILQRARAVRTPVDPPLVVDSIAWKLGKRWRPKGPVPSLVPGAKNPWRWCVYERQLGKRAGVWPKMWPVIFGFYGPRTQNMTIRFKREVGGLVPDAICGGATWLDYGVPPS